MTNHEDKHQQYQYNSAIHHGNYSNNGNVAAGVDRFFEICEQLDNIVIVGIFRKLGISVLKFY